MSEEYDTNEYLITNERRVFAGNALELMTVMYKAEQLPVRVRLYAASKAVEFECDKSGRTLEEIREEVRRELVEADNDDGWKEKLEADVNASGQLSSSSATSNSKPGSEPAFSRRKRHKRFDPCGPRPPIAPSILKICDA